MRDDRIFVIVGEEFSWKTPTGPTDAIMRVARRVAAEVEAEVAARIEDLNNIIDWQYPVLEPIGSIEELDALPDNAIVFRQTDAGFEIAKKDEDEEPKVWFTTLWVDNITSSELMNDTIDGTMYHYRGPTSPPGGVS
jgi:Mg2+/Co2+ transporter CorB